VKDPVELSFFTDFKIIDEAGMWTPGYVWQDLLHDSYDLFFT
jgi:hypothetical protein